MTFSKPVSLLSKINKHRFFQSPIHFTDFNMCYDTLDKSSCISFSLLLRCLQSSAILRGRYKVIHTMKCNAVLRKDCSNSYFSFFICVFFTFAISHKTCWSGHTQRWFHGFFTQFCITNSSIRDCRDNSAPQIFPRIQGFCPSDSSSLCDWF